MTYTAIFGGEELTPAQKEAAKAVSDGGSVVSSTALMICIGGIAVLAAALIWTNQRRNRGRY